MAIAALAPCGMPFLGLDLGEGVVVCAAGHRHYGAISLVMLCGSILTGAAVLRALAEIFLGLGSRQRGGGDTPSHENKEVEQKIPTSPAVMLVPLAMLLAIAVGMAAVGGAEGIAQTGARTFVDHAGYAAAVLDGSSAALPSRPIPSEADEGSRWPAILHGLLGTCGAIVLAAWRFTRALFREPCVSPAIGLRGAFCADCGDFTAETSATM